MLPTENWRARATTLAALAAVLFLALLAGCGKELPPAATTTDGYERVVLAELFTAVWCGNCPLAEAALDKLHDEAYPAPGSDGQPRLAVIHWHPSYGPGDPFAIPAADDRLAGYSSFFGSQVGLPMCIFNGASGIPNGTAQSYQQYREKFDQYAGLASPLRIELSGQLDGNRAVVETEVSVFPGASVPDEAELVVVVVEHHAPIPGAPGETMSYVARAAASATLEVGAAQGLTRETTLQLDPAWKRADLHLVAFVQELEPSPGHDFREVLQAAMTPLVKEQEDFYAFVLSTPEEEIGIAIGDSQNVPFSIHNTGTLADTLSVDLPPALVSVPADWIVEFVTSTGAGVPTPATLPLAPGETASGLRIRVAAPTAGSGSLALVVSSSGNPALVDTLTLALTSGTYGLELGADETDLSAIAERPVLAAFRLTNTGTLSDSASIDIPAALNTLPAGWSVALSNPDGITLATPYALRLAPGATVADLTLKVTAGTEGTGRLGLVVASHGQPTLADTLTFTFTARLYDFTLSTPDDDVWVVVGAPAFVPFEIENTGARADLLRLDLSGLQELPEGWNVSLGYDHDLPVETPYWLPLEAGAAATRFGLLLRAGTAAVGSVHLVVTSSGDPSLVDTLTFTITADQYAFELTAPDGTDLALEIGTPALAPLVIANTGTLDDTLIVDLPAPLSTIPQDWEVFLADAAGAEVSVPYLLPLAAGASESGLRLRALAPGEGEAEVVLVVSSRALPALADTLHFTLTAQIREYGFELTAAETVIYVSDLPITGAAAFEIVNTGIRDDEIHLAVQPVGSLPSGWETPIICEKEGTCWGPFYDADLPLGTSVTNLVIDVVIREPGTGTARLIGTSAGDPSLSDTLTFTFTTEAAPR